MTLLIFKAHERGVYNYTVQVQVHTQFEVEEQKELQTQQGDEE